MTHPYTPSLHSNAGNCVCGWSEGSSVHPHAYAQAYRDNACVCALPAGHPIHTDAATAKPSPVYPETGGNGLRGTDEAREAVTRARGDRAAPQTPVTFALEGPR